MKYYILCNEGWPLSSWSKPYTRQEIQDKFYDYATMEWDEYPQKRYFTMAYISELWNVTFEKDPDYDDTDDYREEFEQ